MTGVPRVPANMTQPLLVELCIPHETAAGNHTGRIFINGTIHHQGSPPKAFALVVPVSVTVWPIEIPDTDDAEAFSPFFNFYTNELSDWYPHLSETEVLSRWMPFLAHHRKRHDSLAVAAARFLRSVRDNLARRHPGNLDLPRRAASAQGLQAARGDRCQVAESL